MNKIESKENAKKYLRNLIKLESKIPLQIFITKVSKSGMTRRMKVYYNYQVITGFISELTDLSLNDDGLKIVGCGMDMCFWLSSRITKSLYSESEQKEIFSHSGGCGIMEYQAIY